MRRADVAAVSVTTRAAFTCLIFVAHAASQTGCAQTDGANIMPGDNADLSAHVSHDLRAAMATPDFALPLQDLSIPVADPGDAAGPAPCMPGTIVCNGGCIDPMSDHANCGACGSPCDVGQACVGGQCQCSVASCQTGCCMGSRCLAGNEDGACGAGGQACVACNTRCQNGGCLGCKPNDVDTQPCGNCGTHTRTCDGNGIWSVFGQCGNQGVCPPNTTRLIACGNCGSQTDLCGGNCQWQPGQCTHQGVCVQGATRSMGCGNCGTQTDSCDNTCQWKPGACGNQGPCVPGATQAGGCDQCSQKVCGNNCQWAGCSLKPGNACEYQAGNDKRGCACKGACAGMPFQWCLNTCQWSKSCDCCTVNNGCNLCN